MRFLPWPLLLIAIACALVAVATTAAADDYTFPGDYVVGAHDTYDSDNLYVTGDVIVNPGGWLDLVDTNVVLMGTSDGQFRVYVDTGGKLTMDGGSVSADNSSYRYKFVVYGEANLEGVTITDTWGQGADYTVVVGSSYPPLSNLKGGVQIYSDDVYIGNSTLSDGYLCMVYVGAGSTPTLYGNTFRDVIYDVRAYEQTTSNPSTTRWTASAFGIILDGTSATVRSNDFSGIGVFTTMTGVYYAGTATNLNDYHVIAAAIGARSTQVSMDSCTIAGTGTLAVRTRSFTEGSNTVNQQFDEHLVAGIYGYKVAGSDLKLNTITSSYNGVYMLVTDSATGGPMDFDVIIDNEVRDNANCGLLFDVRSVARDCTINISDNDVERNGDPSSTTTSDDGVLVLVRDGTGDVTVVLQQNNIRNNQARGALVSASGHSGAVSVLATNSNTFGNNGGAGLLLTADGVGGDIRYLVENTTATGNSPQLTGDPGAVGISGGDNTGRLDVKLADVTSSANTGSGLGINMGGMLAVNLATTTTYTIINCAFSGNDQYGIYLFDSYGANAQRSTYRWQSVHASNNRQAVYVHSNSQLGNINFRLDGLTANDASTTSTAVTFQMAAATYNPKSLIQDLTINYAGGAAPSATGLSLQGVDENKRWVVDIIRADITQPGTALDAQFCEVSVLHSTLEGVGVNSIIARDSFVHMRYCQVPDLSAQTQGTGVNIGVYFYRWFNVSLIAWQNSEPIVNQTVMIKRFRDPQREVYTAATDGTGKLPSFMVPYWEIDSNNNPLRNDELQAFMNVRGDNLNSLWFDFNDTMIGIEDPDVPELIINSPGEGTVQKAGTMVIQGEIRDTHSGVRFVEVTIDRVVWWPIAIQPSRIGKDKATFSHSIINLTDGVYTIVIRGWDVARYPRENLSFAEVTIKDVKIDTQPPALQVTEPPTAYFVTNNKTYEIIGQTERSVNIRKLTINDTLVPIYGTTFSLVAQLHEGSNFFVVIAEDMAGNIAVSTREIILDTNPPTLIVSSPTHLFSSNEQDFEVAGDTEQTATVWVKLDSKPPQEVRDRGGTRFYFVQTIKDEGPHTITVISEDVAGNTFEEVVVVRYDITPPVLEDIVPTLDPKPTNQQTVQVSGYTDKDVEQVTVNGLRFEVQDGYFAAEINLLEGPQLLMIHVKDLAGNENFTTRSILIDVTPPLLLDLTVSSTKAGGPTWQLTEDLVINERSVRFRGRLAEHDNKDLYIQVEADNRSAIMDDPEALTFYRDFNLDEGENIISFFATDIAGNRLQLIYFLNVDPRAPTIEYFHPKLSSAMEAKVDEETVFISGKVTDKGSVTLFVNNRQVLVNPTTGAFQTNVPLEQGLNNIPVEVTDRAGNRATDLLHITYEEEGSSATAVGEVLASLWWVFAIVLGLLVLIPFTVHTTRNKWVQDHPELENWDPQRARDGLYEIDDGYEYYDDQYRGGGGY